MSDRRDARRVEGRRQGGGQSGQHKKRESAELGESVHAPATDPGLQIQGATMPQLRPKGGVRQIPAGE